MLSGWIQRDSSSSVLSAVAVRCESQLTLKSFSWYSILLTSVETISSSSMSDSLQINKWNTSAYTCKGWGIVPIMSSSANSTCCNPSLDIMKIRICPVGCSGPISSERRWARSHILFVLEQRNMCNSFLFWVPVHVSFTRTLPYCIGEIVSFCSMCSLIGSLSSVLSGYLMSSIFGRYYFQSEWRNRSIRTGVQYIHEIWSIWRNAAKDK